MVVHLLMRSTHHFFQGHLDSNCSAACPSFATHSKHFNKKEVVGCWSFFFFSIITVVSISWKCHLSQFIDWQHTDHNTHGVKFYVHAHKHLEASWVSVACAFPSQQQCETDEYPELGNQSQHSSTEGCKFESPDFTFLWRWWEESQDSNHMNDATTFFVKNMDSKKYVTAHQKCILLLIGSWTRKKDENENMTFSKILK